MSGLGGETATSADVYAVTLQAWEIAHDAGDRDQAFVALRGLLSGLDPVMARRVAACLAVESVWTLPPSKVRAGLRRRVQRLRLEITWLGS